MRIIQAIITGLKLLRKITAAVTLLIALSGCGNDLKPQFNPNWVLDEHGNPEFKPNDFMELTQELKANYEQICQLPHDKRKDLIQIFQQMVRWIPEFAAETDIRRSSWEQLNFASGQILDQTFQPDFFSVARRNSFFESLNELSVLVPKDLNHSKENSKTGN